MINSFKSPKHSTQPKSKPSQKEELSELKLTIESSQAKQQLSNISSVFNINQLIRKRTSPKLSNATQLGAWTQSDLPFLSSTSRNAVSVNKKRKFSCQQKFSSMSKRPKTSCLTQADTNTPKSMMSYQKRQLTLSKICPSEKQIFYESAYCNQHLKFQNVTPKQNIKHPFKSNMILFKSSKKNYPYFKRSLKTSQDIETRDQEKPLVENLFKEDRINRQTLLGFIQNINRLRSKEKSKSQLDSDMKSQ